ncbi:methionine--tRNA ligase [Dolosicoccus paucivorans]|uniref:methionine--tRNA ligase n=1 Tax=Dolosicoccus paucivorans TaxID=84521 RepID=UPI00088E28F1|nr:methionine--tRNA ligase [Dolosicoccus paucivorans]SDI80824.1 methionyl-tRNA synthetase [Dolosicoccus paucivorans]
MQNQNKTFYLTTPIYYPSGRLHIGNTYTTVFADAVARYKRLMNYDTFFLTGTDEHGQKIESTAQEQNMQPQEYVDMMADYIQDLWKQLEITHDKFIRTTDGYHKEAVQQIFERLLEQGDIYLGEYQGWYSVSDEEFFTESQLIEVYRDDSGKTIGGVAPSGHEVELVKEESYFFKLSRYADRLVDYYESHPDFLIPQARKNEMINNFIKPGLEDLAVTRTSFKWGVPVESDPKHVVYVWIDALSNYITALGYGSEDTENFERYWPANLQIIGKDISRFHMIYWPALLMALDLPLPKTIFAHGWLVMKDGKMSKSKGNVIYPEMLIERYGLDATRYYLLREMGVGNDSVFTPEDFVLRINTELANDLGNLLNRTIAMVNQYLEGNVPAFEDENVGSTEFDEEFEEFVQQELAAYHEAMDQYYLSQALEHVVRMVSRTNKYIDETTPWVLAKDETKASELKSVMYHLVESLRLIAHTLRPMMPQVPLTMFAQLGLHQEADRLLNDVAWGQLPSGVKVVAKGTPIFPRLDVKEEVQFISDKMHETMAQAGGQEDEAWDPEETELVFEETKHVDFDQFIQTEIKVAEVIDVDFVEGSNKLLQFRLDAGDKGHRQVLSGIAKVYPEPKELIGKKVLVVANLKPRKMMGLVSQGMILSAEYDGKLELVFAPENATNGSLIG